MVERVDVDFNSGGDRCAAWLYRPPGADEAVPCVVMAHGFSLTRHDGLSRYAEALSEAGAAVLVYDHRHLGDSGGLPRQQFRLSKQLSDRHAAIGYVRSLDGIDPDRVILWGYSASGGTAVDAAGIDERIAGLILLCPFLDGHWRGLQSLRTQPRNVVWLIAKAATDAMIPVTAEPGGHAALTFPDEAAGFRNATAGSPWRNEIRSAGAMATSWWRPVTKARKLSCPILLQLGERDITVSARAIERTARRAPAAELRRYDVDHFGPFYGDHLADDIVADQCRWLQKLH